SSQFISLSHLMKLLLELSFKLIEERELQQMTANLDLVAVLQELLRNQSGAIQVGSVGGAEIPDVILETIGAGFHARHFCMLARGYVVSQHDVTLRAAPNDRVLFLEQ